MFKFYLWQTLTPKQNVKETPNFGLMVRWTHTIKEGHTHFRYCTSSALARPINHGVRPLITFSMCVCKVVWKRILWKQVWYFISKNQPGLWRSNPLKSSPGSHSLLVSDSVASRVAARFWHFRSQSASIHRVYIASASQYPSWTRNCAGLLTVAPQSSRLNCLSRIK